MSRRAYSRLRAASTTVLVGAGALLALAAPAGASAAPPGNNGTVKVDDVVFDDHPNNEPHVGCVFQVDLYGYDLAGENETLTADITFEAWAPTGDRGPLLLTDTLDIGEDEAGGGNDLDASGTYDLTEALAGIEPHDQQGWHVKLTIEAEGSIGNDTKHKVFWVSGCEPEQPGTTTTTRPKGSTTTVPHGSTTTVPDGSTTTVPHGSTTTVPGGSTTTVPGTPPAPGGPTTSVQPVASTSTVPTTPPTTMTSSEGSLPRTGSTTMPLVVAGVALASVGAAVLGGVRLARSRA